MKKLILYLLFGFSMGTLCAQTLTEQDALQKAHAFFRSPAHSAPSINSSILPLRCVHTAYRSVNHKPAYYVFNRGNKEGFVLISAENGGVVLGYANHGNFDADNLPDNMREWLKGYVYYQENQDILNPISHGAKDETPAIKYNPISPLVQSHWHQFAPYNNDCPKEGEYQTVAGCVAIAGAQIMNYHKYPEQGEGAYAYSWQGQWLSANFEETHYDWEHILNDYNDSIDEQSQSAVAQLVYHVGVACTMNYGSSGSGSYVRNLINSLYTYFKYDKGICTWLYNYFSKETLLEHIIDDLEKGLPLVVSGNNLSFGHAFICDGIDENGFLHYNFGWGEGSDGYFTLDRYDPSCAGGFGNELTFYGQIQPNKGKPFVPSLGAEYQIITKEVSKSINKFSLAYSHILNLQDRYCATELGLMFFTPDGKYVATYTDPTPVYFTEYDKIDNHFINLDIHDMPAGDYLVSPCVREVGQDTAYEILVFQKGPERCPAKIADLKLSLSPIIDPNISPENLHLGSDEEYSFYTDIFHDYELSKDSLHPGTWILTSSEYPLQVPRIIFHSDSNAQTLPKGTYPINYSLDSGTVEASNGFLISDSISGSYVYTPTLNGYGTIWKRWFLTVGSVDVNDSVIVINGYNSFRRRVYMEFGNISHPTHPTIEDLNKSGFTVGANCTHVLVLKVNQDYCYGLAWRGRSYNIIKTYSYFRKIIGFGDLVATCLNYPNDNVEIGQVYPMYHLDLVPDEFAAMDEKAWTFIKEPEFSQGYMIRRDDSPYPQLYLPQKGYYKCELSHFLEHRSNCDLNLKYYSISVYLPPFCDEIASYNCADSIKVIGQYGNGIGVSPIINVGSYSSSTPQYYFYTGKSQEGAVITLHFGTQSTSALQIMNDGIPIAGYKLGTRTYGDWLLDEEYYFDRCATDIVPTSWETTHVTPSLSTKKLIHNGKIHISRDGKCYNILGTQLTQ